MPGRLTITAVPPGEAPQWVREAWVGLSLSPAQVPGARTYALTLRCRVRPEDVAGSRAGPRHRPAVAEGLSMPKLRVQSFSVSIDGYGAGPGQDLEHPLGVAGEKMFEWAFRTRTWTRMHGQPDGETGVDDDIAAQGFAGVGAWILGRNMFGPVRGPWPDESWKGWWGEEPPYHVPVFVLTHHRRKPLAMAGGTEFRFVTERIHAALDQARRAAGDRDVRLRGGVATVRQYLQAGLIDEVHLAMVPVLLGRGEHLLSGLDLRALGYECVERIEGGRATHVILRKRA